LPEFLALVEALTGRVSELLAEFVPIDAIPELLPDHLQRESARRVAYDEPWTEAILRVLETIAYQSLPAHRPGYVAEQLNIATDIEKRCLEKLEQCGIVRREGERYMVASSLNVDTGAVPMLKIHWSNVASHRILSPSADDLFAYNVISVSEVDLHRIRELLRSTFREIRVITAGSSTSERVALINLQLTSW
jgi:hypothetical protein